MKCTLLDTETGETQQDDTIPCQAWADGNWCCDCNRQSYFLEDHEQTEECKTERFVVVAFELTPEEREEGWSYNHVDWFNDDYPKDARLKAINWKKP